MAVAEHDGAYSLPHESITAGSGSSSSQQDSNDLRGGSAPTGEISGNLVNHLLKVRVVAHGENHLVSMVVLRCMIGCLHL